MEYLVIAEIEIDGNKVEHYTNITLRQKFNAHHEFIIRISHDVLEATGSFSLENAQKKIGKPVLLRFQKMELSMQLAFEFRGIICEVRMEQSGKSDADLVFTGYSPTIVLENGQHLTSFYKNDLKKIVQQVTKPLGQVNCNVNIKNQYSKQITYICQYRESGFHFLNRLSDEFSEFFYYDGKELNFGKPSSVKEIEITYGEDLSSMQMTLQAQPMKFSKYAYISKEDKVEKYDAPETVNGLGQYASFVFKESDNLYSEPVNLPIKQRVDNKADLELFSKKLKAALAANLEILTGTCYNPEVSIGSVILVKVSKLQELNFVKEDYGKFLVTGIEHHVNENGKYFNTFEAIPSTVEVLPKIDIIIPLAEPQIATVKDNKDTDGMGRVRVQMLWQKGSEMTDWVRVMTPDAGGGKGGAKNRGFVAIPEPGDQVLVCFHYNDPDKPFVMGSLFHGKSGGGGGSGNVIKSLTSLSGSTVSLDGNDINIIDATGNYIKFFGDGDIQIKASASISLKVGDSYINIEPTQISIYSENVAIKGTKEANLKIDDSTYFMVRGSEATIKAATAIMDATTAEVKGANEAKLNGAQVKIDGTTLTEIKGGIVQVNP